MNQTEQQITIEQVFDNFKFPKAEMDNKQFAKFTRDTKILDERLTDIYADIIFSKNQNKINKKLSFKAFEQCLRQMSERKKIQQIDLQDQIKLCPFPIYCGTKAKKVRLHDDKSTYTGVYSRGGPNIIDTGHPTVTINKQLMNNTILNNQDKFIKYRQHQVSKSLNESYLLSIQTDYPHTQASKQQQQILLKVFNLFKGKKKELDIKQYAKFTRDCKILDSSLNDIECDIIFAKNQNKKTKQLNFQQFQSVILMIANKKGVSFESLVNQLGDIKGPIYFATKINVVRLHDDKSTYTGVYAKGGPTYIFLFTLQMTNKIRNIDIGYPGCAISNISQLCDRTPADVRGCKKKQQHKSYKGFKV